MKDEKKRHFGQKTAQEALDDYVEKGNQVIDEGRANSVVYNQ